MDKSNLLPCPFCGGEPTLDEGEFFEVMCKKCFRAGTVFYSTRSEAIEAWNTRATLGSETCHSIDPVDSSEFFICSNCNFGAGVVEFIPNYCPNCGRKVVG